MDTKRDNAAARTAVTKLLRQYFDGLRARLAAGTSQFWGRIEQRLAQGSATPDFDQSKPPIRQQPAQQQQARTERNKTETNKIESKDGK